MFDKRLFRMAPGIGRLVAGKVACLWVGLLANIGFMIALVALFANLLTAADPHMFACDAASPADCPTNLFDFDVQLTPMPGDFMFYALMMLCCALLRYGMTTLAARLGTEASERVKLALRERLYRKMLDFGPSYAQHVRTADVVQSAGEGIEQIQSFFELFLPQLFYAVLAPLTLFAVIAPLDLPTAVTMLVCAPLIVLVVGMVAMSAARVFKRYWGRYTDMGAAFLDDMQGLETLKAFDADGRAARDMDEKAENFRVMTMRVLQIQLRSLSAMDLVAYGGTAAGIGVALWRYAGSDGAFASGSAWSFADLAAGAHGPLAYVAYLLQYVFPYGFGYPLTLSGLMLIVLLSADFFIPLRQLGSFFHVAMNGMTSTKRIFALLDTPVPARGTATLPAGDAAPPVRFDHVRFAYDDASGASDAVTHAPALRDVTFEALPGQVTAIVGVSGSGKSTAAALLSGSIAGYAGSVTIDGVDVSALSGEALARAVTGIGARSHLFAGTLRDNLMMALPVHDSSDVASDSTPDDVDPRLWHALEQARIADFVRTQPAGLDMPIEQDAANLSGGQRQRIAIARALLHDAPVIVFDEATSSVDVESEELILAAIRDLAAVGGKTVVMITHRMANARGADRIVVFDHGETVETGTHDTLMQTDGRYAELFRTQAGIEALDETAATEPVAVAGTVATAESAGTAASDTAGETAASAGTAETIAAHRMSTPQLIARLLGEAKPLAHLMTAACVAGTLGHLSATFLPVFGMAAAFALAGNPVWGLGAPAAVAAMVVCAVLRGLMRYVEQYLNHNVAFHLLALFRSKAFAALRRLAPAKLAGHGKGDLIAMLTTDVELLEIFFAHTISPVVIALVTSVAYAVVLLAVSPWMALALVVAHLVIGVVVPRFFATGVHNLGPSIRRQASELDDVMLDDMRGLDEIIRFGRGEDRVGAIVDRTKRLWREHARLSRVNGRFAGIDGLLVLALTAAAAGVTLALAAATPASSPALVTGFVLFASSFGPTLALSALPANLTQTFASARRLFALMDETPAVTETGAATPAYEGMRLDHVTFAYDGGASDGGASGDASDGKAGDASDAVAVPPASRPVFEDVTLDVPRAGILGVQGPSGCGKSTMLKLLMRYWDPRSGTVLLSGTPLPAVDAHHRRRVQALMGQETHLFDGTIRENLLIALPEERIASTSAETLDATLREACRKASVLDFVESLPDGLDTAVGELGDRLSEGERQRIGLARVFLRDADLVLFDEPTSRLDALNEAVILRSIRDLATGGNAEGTVDAAGSTPKAVVLVSHRESAMRIADAVVRM
ncbi:ATP-binding cassette domain-containing protein [Bifidobacterium sp. CP2]|uniref:ABC transporter ATP-binding protein/permease n=1 Tax=Bifidobacterium sp. CP2 TaxID=2809025 RepID=UPI001BDC89CB|nr:ATP-binding cassette domain-containing protein [Bifidobacterium sp. CP2]MBT1180821.1 ATP-binding cassette domain-containing protein [Bifidobacterium sp. CP2]